MIRRLLLRSSAIVPLAFAAQLPAQTDRSVLPIPQPAFTGTISENAHDSTPQPSVPLRAPDGAPNVLVLMSDDVGFGMPGTFGGLISTPNLDRIASLGQRYNRFHTTGICSPSRAALLTGRNHHAVGAGYLGESGYPGYDGRIPASAATIAQTLRLNGYNTAMFGKHHNTPGAETSAAGPFDLWPTGLGFEYFYGFVDGYADQFSPKLYRGTDRQPDAPDTSQLLDKRLADDAINWIHNQKAAAPDKPFFIYYAPGSAHVPLQAPEDYINRFRHRFDQGWDKVREEIFARQLKAGVIPRNTRLTARPDGIPAWASLSDQERTFFARTMEVAAGMLAYQDAQVGRIFDELERMGELDNTLVILIEGDNGAPAESGNAGAVNEMYRTFGGPVREAITPEVLRTLGGARSFPAYPAGWAWAMNTPFRWAKQHAASLGGIRNGMVMAWPSRFRPKPNTVCAQFGHLVDVALTILDAAGLPAPQTVLGAKQQPLDGESLLGSLARCDADHPRTQYFEISGKVGLYHDGWFASLDDGRKPWEYAPPEGGQAKTITSLYERGVWPSRPPADSEMTLSWSLYDLRADFSQGTDVSRDHPEKLKELVALWKTEATRNHVFPLNHGFALGRGGAWAAGGPARQRRPLQFWGKNVSIVASRLPATASFTLTAQLQLEDADASGVVAAVGGHFSGWSLLLDHGRPTLVYAASVQPQDVVRIAAKDQLPKGKSTVRLSIAIPQPGGPGKVKLFGNDGALLAEGDLPRTYVTHFSGETLDIGLDTGVKVTPYVHGNGEIEGDIEHVSIAFD